MKRAVMLTAALLLRAHAGVAVLDAVSSCPSIIKSVDIEDTVWSGVLTPRYSPVTAAVGGDTAITIVAEDTISLDTSAIGAVATDTTSLDTSTIGIVATDTTSFDTSAIITVATDTTSLDTSTIITVVKDTISLDTSTIITVATDTTSLDTSTIITIDKDTTSLDSSIVEAAWVGSVRSALGVWFPGGVKFGRRAAFNYSQVAGMRVRIYSHDGESFSYKEYRDKAGFGVGFEVAGIFHAALSGALAFNLSPGVVFRKPVNTAVVGTSEVGVSFPALLEWRPFAGPDLEPDRGDPADAFAKSRAGGFDWRQLRLFGGIWVGVPIYAWVTWNGEKSVAFSERSAADLGLAVGAGAYVSDRAFVDVKGIIGLSGYDGVKGRRLNQLSVGVNYVR